jgi:hypothetical protein
MLFIATSTHHVVNLVCRSGPRGPTIATVMPRPPKPKKSAPLGHLHIRLSDELKRKLELAAARDGLDLSSFARTTMIRRARELGIEV